MSTDGGSPDADPLPQGAEGRTARRAVAQSREKVTIARHPRKGRCVVAIAPIAKGELIEAAPALVLSEADGDAIEGTTLADYCFWWDGDPDVDGRDAVAFGIASFCNHSAAPVAEVLRNYNDQTFELVAISPIAPGTEVTIRYKCELWFEPCD